MNCPAREDLEAFFDREVTPDEMRALEAHLGACEPCRTVLGEIRAIWDALDAYPEPDVRRIDPRAIVAEGRIRQRRMTYLRIGYVAAAVAIFVITLWGVGVLDTGERIPPAPTGLVANWEIIHDLDMLQGLEEGDLEILENMEILEELPLELVNGSENG